MFIALDYMYVSASGKDGVKSKSLALYIKVIVSGESFTYSFTYQNFPEHLLYARHNIRCWVYRKVSQSQQY